MSNDKLNILKGYVAHCGINDLNVLMGKKEGA
jgi:hypothetical protein